MRPPFVLPMRDILRQLETEPRFAPNVTALRELPARPAEYGPWPASLHPDLRLAAEHLGIRALYRHQSVAISAALAGRDVATVAGTAAGKSLCYLLPLMDNLLRHPEARALLIFPTKALAHDQLAALRKWDAALPDLALGPAAYDGDTPSGARGQARRQARILITNPDMLHAGILPHHPRWADFLAGLSDVVLDEMHVYRGVFGSHVANLLRRLRRVVAFHAQGRLPRFAFGSATIGNPAELAAQLAGRPVAVVGEDGAPRGRRSFVIYNPPVIDAALNIRRSAVLEAEQLARHCLAAGVQTIAFARSRQGAELLLRYLAEGLARDGLTGGGPKDPKEVDAGPLVRGYRGGYRAGERREIEAALREGRLRGVVATNALELGIDIGELDACVMLGYPGSIASTWQQAGRAGRRGGESLALLVAGASPLDQFIARHPDYLFDRSSEQARIDPDNLLILLDHVRCAAFELPFDAEEASRVFGGQGMREAGGDAPNPDALAEGAFQPAPPASSRTAPKVAELLAVLEAQGQIQYSGGSWYWLAEAYPAGTVSLRSSGPTPVAVILGEPPSQSGAELAGEPSEGRSELTREAVSSGWDGSSVPNRESRPRAERQGSGRSDPDLQTAEVLGTVERSSAPTMLHPGAVYLHAGEAYEVQALDLEAGRAWLRPSDGSIYTRASSRVDIRPLSQAAARPAQGVDLAWGELEVRSRATGYRRIRFRTHETLGWGKIDLPEQQHVAGGYWFTLRDETLKALRELGRWQHDPLRDRGRDWPRQAALARARDGQRCQLCDAPELEGRAHDVHHIRPYRGFGDQPGSEANALDNLITLCKACHRIAERALGLHGGLQGLGHALGHVAPLFLMCDDRDIGVKTESHASWSKRPTVVVYERAAAGLGFGEALYGLHARLIAAATELIADCPCALGCPSCVGPAGEQGPDAKAHAIAVLRALA